jgi:hypothetical protein
MPSEPLLTYLMPVSAVASWAGLYLTGSTTGAWKVPVAAFGSIWALYNIITRKKMDLGFFTMGLVAVSAYMEQSSGASPGLTQLQLVGCVLVSINYALPVVFWKELRKMFVKSKSPFWLNTFYTYCATNTVFWLIGAYTIYKN